MFPITEQTPISHNPDLPASADVVVIGGGVVGVMTAWELARDGHSVVLLEKGRIAGEQSSRNWGWVRAQGRDIAELPIMLAAQTMWPTLEKEAGDVGLRQTGTLYLAKTADDMAGFQNWLDLAKPYQVSSHLLTSGQVADRMPAAARRWAGALFTPTDYRAEPWVTVPKFAHAAVRAGAIIKENCAVRLLEVAGGRIAGVVTEHGVIKAQSVVVAGGAWSSLLLRRHGVDIPQLSVRATVAKTATTTDIYDGGAADDRLAWRLRQDGGYTLAAEGSHDLYVGPDAVRHLKWYAKQFLRNPLRTRLRVRAPQGYPDGWRTPRNWASDDISPFEARRVLNPTPNAKTLRQLPQNFTATFPVVGPTQIDTAWAGMIDVMPDVVPVVDTCAALPGLTIATGMSGHGFGIGPGFGRIAARLATGRDPGHDLTRFRLSRFTDGSALDVAPSL